ncbi:MAG TPA: oxaloacetate decarboxylase [Candidatus Cybelea sp.]|nr:oxaloacetate decarboxylase [Candidatus Cybelea sp.]
MNAPSPMTLQQQLAGRRIVVAPGCYDGLSALLIEQAGFACAYLSGAGIAYTRFGRSDIGLVTMTEVADVISAIAERIAIPIIVDADTGFGNALNVQRTVRRFERAGAAAIQIEDQSTPKRCGHLAGKSLVSPSEMVGKIEAALDARRNENTLLIARTDAIAVEGFEAALDRAERYVEAGADILFVEAPQSKDHMAKITARFAGRLPVMANMVEGGKTPMHSAKELEAMGFGLVIFPGGLVRAVAHLARAFFASLREHGTTEPYWNRMLSFQAFNELIGTPALLEEGSRYDAARFERGSNDEGRR